MVPDVVHVLAVQARRLLSCLLATRCCSPAVVCDAEGRHERRTRFGGECRKWKVVCTAHDLCCPRRRRHAAASSPPSCSFAAFAAAGTRSVFARFCCCSSSDSWDEELIWLRKAANPSMKVSATLLRRLICKKCFRHFFSTSVVCEPKKQKVKHLLSVGLASSTCCTQRGSPPRQSKCFTFCFLPWRRLESFEAPQKAHESFASLLKWLTSPLGE